MQGQLLEYTFEQAMINLIITRQITSELGTPKTFLNSQNSLIARER